MLEKMINVLKQFIIGLCVFFIYMLASRYQATPLILFNIDPSSMPLYLKVIYMIGYEMILMAIIIYIFRDKIEKDINDIKINHQKYFSKYLKLWIFSVAIMMISNLLISHVLPNSLPTNEKTIREVFNKSPIYIFFSTVIFAPIVEELVFRQGFRYMFTTDWLFILMSGLVFGSLHVLNSTNSLAELLYLIPYSAPGIIFAYILAKPIIF